MTAIQPLYFVQHPDGSYSEADPQPKLVAWMHPHIVSFKNARTSCPVDVQPEIEGTVAWGPEVYGDDDYAVVDKHGVTHRSYPLYALERSA